MIVVSDTSPLLALADIGRLDLLRQLYGEVRIPQAVHDEILTFAGTHAEAVRAVARACGSWIHIERVKESAIRSILSPGIHRGEAAAMALAKTLKADLILVDDRQARIKLKELGLSAAGTVGVLLAAKGEGLLLRLREDVELLRDRGVYLSDYVVAYVLRMAGEGE